MAKVKTLLKSVAACGVAIAATAAHAANAEVELPGTVIWSSYPTGSTAYSQAVAIGSVLQNEYGTKLRVIPGRNDVARLYPIKQGRAHFAATGNSDVYFAQEGVFDFGTKRWGPQPIRATVRNVSDGCAYTLVTTQESDIQQPSDLKGKRVVYVHGAPSLNFATAGLLAYAGLTWDDVKRVEVGGYPAGIDALISGQLDVVGASCHTPVLLKINSGPLGLQLVEFPHEDQEAVSRVTAKLPWYQPHVTPSGTGIDSKEGYEGFTSAYPTLATMEDTEEGLAYSMSKTVIEHQEQYRDSAPATEGWTLDRQQPEQSMVPYHKGAIEYLREAGIWSEAAEERQQQNLRRQQVLQGAWEQYVKTAPDDEESFKQGWQGARESALKENDMRVSVATW